MTREQEIRIRSFEAAALFCDGYAEEAEKRDGLQAAVMSDIGRKLASALRAQALTDTPLPPLPGPR